MSFQPKQSERSQNYVARTKQYIHQLKHCQKYWLYINDVIDVSIWRFILQFFDILAYVHNKLLRVQQENEKYQKIAYVLSTHTDP